MLKALTVCFACLGCGASTTIDCGAVDQLTGNTNPYTQPCGDICILPDHTCCQSDTLGSYGCADETPECNPKATNIATNACCPVEGCHPSEKSIPAKTLGDY